MKRFSTLFLYLALILMSCATPETDTVVDHTVSVKDPTADVCGVHVSILTEYSGGQTILRLSAENETVSIDQDRTGDRTLQNKTMKIAFFYGEGVMRVWCP